MEVYKKIRISFEGMFALDHRTYRHAAPKMARTLKKLEEYMQTHRAHVFERKRTSKYSVPDMSEAGLRKLMGMSSGADGSVDLDDPADGELEVNGDEGDLEV